MRYPIHWRWKRWLMGVCLAKSLEQVKVTLEYLLKKQVGKVRYLG